MNVSITRVLHFPLIKILIGLVAYFFQFAVLQNFVLKPFFYTLIKNKSSALFTSPYLKKPFHNTHKIRPLYSPPIL